MDFCRLSSESPLKGPFEKVPKREEDLSPLKGSLRVSFTTFIPQGAMKTDFHEIEIDDRYRICRDSLYRCFT